ncbi:hypothetical protein Q9292_13575 [Methylophilus sp. VKM B-3414]|uniref:hypothetical protein n=1 Tax=Methylophilus sp. VKM B-3414 TaxID=3076121 RepID=UPI0028C78D99|nr:hypothetical protein [Methylophilus sp. VKM B-3414]MDT7850639.1 hypothetical protein [Methylophilus sp. VKM B-3414]
MKVYTHLMTALVTATLALAANSALAGKTYDENDFINGFSGKSKKVVLEKLGQPFKKQQSVKPTNANSMIAGIGKQQDSSKPVQVEMWYYKNLVKYDKKNTYKETEVTFVNDRVMNIGFFNNR